MILFESNNIKYPLLQMKKGKPGELIKLAIEYSEKGIKNDAKRWKQPNRIDLRKALYKRTIPVHYKKEDRLKFIEMVGGIWIIHHLGEEKTWVNPNGR